MAKGKLSAGVGLHIPSDCKTWFYDFTIRRKRHRESTGETSYAKALEHTLALRARVRDGIQSRKKPDMTLAAALLRYYEEKGQHQERPDEVLARLERIEDRLGADTLLADISTDTLLRYRTQRLTDGVSNRTTNYDVIDTMRPLFKLARLWGVDVPDDIDWGQLRLDTPRHRVRWLSRSEKLRLYLALPRNYWPLLKFALITGLRKNALLLRKSQIDWEIGLISYHQKSKYDNDIGFLPLTPELRRLLKHECSKDPLGEWVFTYQCRKGRGKRQRKQRYPITPTGFTSTMRRAVAKAELTDWRLIHDLRHTAATEALDRSQDPSAVQRMLGHSDIKMTMKYAHVLTENVRRAMTRNPRKTPG